MHFEGMNSVQLRPSGAKSIETSAPREYVIICSITTCPKPLRVGGLTGGPPDSRQSMRNRPDLRSASKAHVTMTLPSGFDSAPYLMELVVSSCKASPIA